MFCVGNLHENVEKKNVLTYQPENSLFKTNYIE